MHRFNIAGPEAPGGFPAGQEEVRGAADGFAGAGPRQAQAARRHREGAQGRLNKTLEVEDHATHTLLCCACRHSVIATVSKGPCLSKTASWLSLRVLLPCAQVDTEIVKGIIEPARKKFSQQFGGEAPTVEFDSKNFLPPPPGECHPGSLHSASLLSRQAYGPQQQQHVCQ